MIFYHCTSLAAAEAIERDGFMDGRGRYLTGLEHGGVWIADFAATENEGIEDASAVFEIEADEAVIAEFEWIEEGKPYREWLVPAAILNGLPRRRVASALT